MPVDFSIILPTYNNQTLFLRALSSILIQRDVSLEVIITDDSNNNIIGDIVSVINDSRVNYYKNKEKLGPVFNWNYGLSLATGSYLILLHHDESFGGSNYLVNIKKEFQKTKSDCVITGVCVEHSQGRATNTKRYLSRRMIIKHLPFLFFARNVIGPTGSVTFRREILKYFDTSLKWLVDLEWYYRLLNARKVACVDSLTLYSYHGHKDQISRNLKIDYQCQLEYDYLLATYKRELPIVYSIKMRQHIIDRYKRLKTNLK